MEDFKDISFSPKNWMYVVIYPNNSVNVFEVVQGAGRARCLNALRKALKEAGEKVPMTATAEDLICLLAKKFSKPNGVTNTAIVGDWLIDSYGKSSCDLFEKVSNTKAALCKIAESIKMPIDSKWNTQTLGRHVVDCLKK